MRLRVLGSNGTFPSPGRPCSGYLVDDGSTSVWMDTGPGSFAALWQIVDPSSVAAIVVSHRHPDHSVDLMSAFHAYAYGPFVVDGLPVFAPQETIDFIRAYVGGDTIAEVFDFRAVADGDTAVIGDLSLRFAETAHSVVNVATRIETGGRVLVYTGDTGPAGSWPELAQDAHLLLSEASLHDDSEPYEFHLTASQAGSIARERSVRSLMLTHIPPHLDSAVSVLEAERMFDRPVGIAVPGGVVRV